MIDLATGGYTTEAVQKALHAAYGSRRIYYRYDRLDTHKVTLGALYAEDGSIKLDYNADIMRTGRFTIRDDPAVNWQAELLRPWFGLIMPDGGRAEWPLGLSICRRLRRPATATCTARSRHTIPRRSSGTIR